MVALDGASNYRDFSVMLAVSLYFALTSENLLLQAESTAWLALVGLAVLACLGAMLLTDNRVRRQLMLMLGDILAKIITIFP
ncbi:hypothetical protein GTO87_00045 [Ligilactobacillus saerimneri]|uniref:Uncharacterized protein n=1 Tax=Ligilactobacillus saerimneri TaxID=228229 RepID=A0A7H9EHJ9_9LACO|nr:hypothetical protein [Ligilactobacillus saerimneri]QLL77168.1 hypothetical protein GTO87_00045 [Ligilactobacillus saerimneri]